MDQKDLLKLLDLNAVSDPSTHPTVAITPVAANPRTTSTTASPTALVLDEWGLRRGRDLLDESPRLRETGTDAFAAADFFAAGFDPDPQLVPACVEPRRHEFLTQLLDTPDYHALHASTQLNDTAAEIAASHFAEQFTKLQKDDAARASGAATPDAVEREMAAVRAASRAVVEADKEVSELHDATQSLGMGPGSHGSNDAKAIADLFKRVRADPNLRRICELAGSFRRVAQSKQRQKTDHGWDDMVGVEPGGDIGRLLPTELARMMIPELEWETLRRIAERQAMCREHRAIEPVGKGPIILVCDESGSMEGEKAHTAKALALALAWIARQQRRWCGLVAFSGDSGERLLALPPGRWNEMTLCDWLAAFIGHGSDRDVPIVEMPRMYREIGAPPGITDVVFVTDCRCRIAPALCATFQAWKASVKARVLTLVLGDTPGDLAAVSDELYTIATLDADGDAVGRVLSI